GTPTISQWLGQQLSAIDGAVVGVDGSVNSYAAVEALQQELRQEGGITVRVNFDPLARIWTSRPLIPLHPIRIHPLSLAGETASSKLTRLRRALRGCHCDGMLVSALDDIAWLLNLRGNDVHCNPVFVAYLLIDSQRATLYINKVKVPAEVMAYLQNEGVQVEEYTAVGKGLADYFEYNILMDPDETNALLPRYVDTRTRKVFATSPVPLMKAVKNEAEIAGFRQAMLRDGVAMVKFLSWLLPAVQAGNETELSIDRKLTALRAEQPMFRDISFDTIAGYGPHGAIVHYEATPETDVPLRPEGLLLLDSGAQYDDGTTDITRTIALGPVTEEQRHVYTLVLKGHIQLQLARFPKGASGTQIDALARIALWREGYNYLHGTGHGVGACLNVHEGPHQIRMEYRPAPLLPGMTVTDEPGVYLAGRFGVRIENTLLITEGVTTEFGEFLQMETLTWCPIDKTPIDPQLLLPEEEAWLDAYHHKVYTLLAPYLNEQERAWLEEACAPLRGSR
ncbi:MAG: aminopeptidase family protein P, partial [Prevotellaceae bacterium]|nr:aminopeptidase family protein P [Prevotellaceae bacterium]